MKIKTTAELLTWCKDLGFSEEQRDEVIHYVGCLEQVINGQRDNLEYIGRVIDSVRRSSLPLFQLRIGDQRSKGKF